MPKDVAWLVQKVLTEQLDGPSTARGQSSLGPIMASIGRRTCNTQHWFGVIHAGREQELLAELTIANPLLPKQIRQEKSWTVSNIRSAAKSQPALAPLLYFLFEAMGDGTATAMNEESWSNGIRIYYHSDFKELSPVAEPSLQPAPRIVMLRSMFLAAKVLTLLPCKPTTPAAQENLACKCLKNFANTANEQEYRWFSDQPQCSTNGASLQDQLCKQLVKLLAPMMSHACLQNPRHCHYCQERAVAASTVLACLLKHNDMGLSNAVADAFLAEHSGATLMMSLEYKLGWLVLALDMLLLMSDRDAIKAVLKQSNALAHLSFALQTFPLNDETQDILVVEVRSEVKESLRFDEQGTEATRAGQMCMMYTTATLMMKALHLQDDAAAGIDVQIIGVTWAALEWAMEHSHDDESSSSGITALVQLLHKLLAAAPADLNLAQGFSLGVPILLRFLASSAVPYTDTEELVTTVRDILHSAPEMNIQTDDDQLAAKMLKWVALCPQVPECRISHEADRLWSAVEKLLQGISQQSSFTETTYLQLHAATTILHHDSTNSKLVQKHPAGLLQHLNEVSTHLETINHTSADIQSAMTDVAKLIQQLQNEHA